MFTNGMGICVCKAGTESDTQSSEKPFCRKSRQRAPFSERPEHSQVWKEGCLLTGTGLGGICPSQWASCHQSWCVHVSPTGLFGVVLPVNMSRIITRVRFILHVHAEIARVGTCGIISENLMSSLRL